MPVARLRLLGGYEVEGPDGRATSIPNSCRPLVGYLVTNRKRRLDRALVAETLWPDREDRRARRCLSTALWRLKATPDFAAMLDLDAPSQIALNTGRHMHVDVIAFEQRTEALLAERRTPTQRVLHRAIRSLELYRGDAYQRIDAEWADLERERLRLLYVETLSVVARLAENRGDHDEAIKFGSRLATLEPLREDIHRMLMRSYMSKGARALAIAQYRVCQGELASALGIEPMEETRHLYETLVARPDRRQAPDETERLRAFLSAISDRIRSARRASTATTRGIDEALSMIERTTD